MQAVAWERGRGLAPTSAPGLPVPEQQSAAVAGWVGRVLAGHRIDALIGEGGMGVVYRASHLQLRRTVALKVLPPSLTADREYRHRFEREAAIAASLEHPNVVPIYDAGYANGVLYLSMRVRRRRGPQRGTPAPRSARRRAAVLPAGAGGRRPRRRARRGSGAPRRQARQRPDLPFRAAGPCTCATSASPRRPRRARAHGGGAVHGHRALLVAGADRGPVGRRPLRPVRPGLPRLPRAAIRSPCCRRWTRTYCWPRAARTSAAVREGGEILRARGGYHGDSPVHRSRRRLRTRSA